MIKRSTWIFVFSFLLFLNSVAQRKIDSLYKVVETTNDTNKVNAIINLASLDKKADTSRMRELLNEAINLSVKLDYKKGIVYSYCQKSARILNFQDANTAFDCLNKAARYLDTIKPNEIHHKYLMSLASIYGNTGEMDKAIDCYLKALKISDLMKNETLSATAYHGLCFIHVGLHNYDKAEEYGIKALEKYKKLNNESGIAQLNSSMGGVYLSKYIKSKSDSDLEKAKAYLNDAIEACIKVNDTRVLPVCYTNLGILYGEQKNYNMALQYCKKALDIKTQSGNKYGMVATMITISEIFARQNKPDSLGKYIFKAFDISKEINAPSMTSQCYSHISSYYELKKDLQKALEYHKRWKEVNDSLMSSENMKSLADAEEKYESEKKDKEIKLLGEVQKAKDDELSTQRIVNYTIAGGLVLVLILSVFMFRQYSQKKKAHGLLEKQNEIINEKNRNITDSINYAKVIQNAILLSEEELSAVFPNTFILFKPKDIVSGDFYWFAEKNGRKLIAAVDCTGHGVPGAFMSMIGSSFLNEIVNERGVTQPAEILGLLRDKIKKALKQKGEIGDSKDGMDIALLSFDENLSSVEFAGANNGLCLIRAGSKEVTEVSPDKRPIGYYMGKGLPFTNHKIDLKKGDSLYIFTDGYADQFGGPKGKKFKYKQLIELIRANTQRSAEEQKQLFSNTIESWKGNIEQTDDICLIGIKV